MMATAKRCLAMRLILMGSTLYCQVLCSSHWQYLRHGRHDLAIGVEESRAETGSSHVVVVRKAIHDHVDGLRRWNVERPETYQAGGQESAGVDSASKSGSVGDFHLKCGAWRDGARPDFEDIKARIE